MRFFYKIYFELHVGQVAGNVYRELAVDVSSVHFNYFVINIAILSSWQSWYSVPVDFNQSGPVVSYKNK